MAHQQQRDHHRHHESSELSSLRATVANLDRENDELRKENYKLLLEKIAHYEQKEHEQLQQDNKALRETVAWYERKEKEQGEGSPPAGNNSNRAREDDVCDSSEEKDASNGLIV